MYLTARGRAGWASWWKVPNSGYPPTLPELNQSQMESYPNLSHLTTVMCAEA